jgi:hypothetical protein
MLGKSLVGEYDTAKPDLHVIWGWMKIRSVLESQKGFDTNQNLRKMYFDACLNYAQVRYQMAQEAKEAETKTKWFNSAKTIIEKTFDKDPNFGEPGTKAEYEKLLKSVQAGLKQTPNGFQEFIDNQKKNEATPPVTAATAGM